jgi:hypothetical protein
MRDWLLLPAGERTCCNSKEWEFPKYVFLHLNIQITLETLSVMKPTCVVCKFKDQYFVLWKIYLE